MAEVVVEPGAVVEVDTPGDILEIDSPAFSFEATTAAWNFEVVSPDTVSTVDGLGSDVQVLLLPGPAGPTGPAGPPGSTFRFTQATPAASWLIVHNLGYRPSVVVLVDGEHVYTDVDYLDDTSLTLTFPQPTAGQADLS